MIGCVRDEERLGGEVLSAERGGAAVSPPLPPSSEGEVDVDEVGR